MAEINYSTIPAIVTITNIAEDERIYDAGTRYTEVKIPKTDLEPGETFTEIEDDGSNVLVKRKFKTGDRRFQFYKTNSYCVLKPGDVLKILAESSAALCYYMSLNSEDLTVTAEAKG